MEPKLIKGHHFRKKETVQEFNGLNPIYSLLMNQRHCWHYKKSVPRWGRWKWT